MPLPPTWCCCGDCYAYGFICPSSAGQGPLNVYWRVSELLASCCVNPAQEQCPQPDSIVKLTYGNEQPCYVLIGYTERPELLGGYVEYTGGVAYLVDPGCDQEMCSPATTCYFIGTRCECDSPESEPTVAWPVPADRGGQTCCTPERDPLCPDTIGQNLGTRARLLGLGLEGGVCYEIAAYSTQPNVDLFYGGPVEYLVPEDDCEVCCGNCYAVGHLCPDGPDYVCPTGPPRYAWRIPTEPPDNCCLFPDPEDCNIFGDVYRIFVNDEPVCYKVMEFTSDPFADGIPVYPYDPIPTGSRCEGCCTARGACCIGPGGSICVDGETLLSCLQRGGIYQGDGVACGPLTCPSYPVPGACCVRIGKGDPTTCLILTLEQCEHYPGGGTFIGGPCVPNPCIPKGACCCGTNCTPNTTREECEAAECVWKGAGTTCVPVNPCVPPTGACCVNDTCIIASLATCNLIGGIYKGNGIPCVPDPCAPDTGACCIGSQCSIRTLVYCERAGGIFQGVGTTCDPNPCPQGLGACCLPTGECQVLSEEICLEIPGGAWQGSGTLCRDGACDVPCCLESDPYYFCTDTSLNGCLNNGGRVIGTFGETCAGKGCPGPTCPCDEDPCTGFEREGLCSQCDVECCRVRVYKSPTVTFYDSEEFGKCAECDDADCDGTWNQETLCPGPVSPCGCEIYHATFEPLKVSCSCPEPFEDECMDPIRGALEVRCVETGWEGRIGVQYPHGGSGTGCDGGGGVSANYIGPMNQKCPQGAYALEFIDDVSQPVFTCCGDCRAQVDGLVVVL